MIIDAHCDTLEKVTYNDNYRLKNNNGHLSLDMLRETDSLCQFFAIYIERDYMNIKTPYEIFIDMYKCYQFEMGENRNLIKPVLKSRDIMKNHEVGKLSSILAIEDAVCAEGKLDRIKEFYEKGVRAITLVWNYENEIAYPNSDNNELHMKGLKPLAFDFIDMMNELGIIVDVSHLSEGGFFDVYKHSKKPFMATHSCARAICNHQRNLTDEQLKALGDSGSVVGVNFEASFLRDNSTYGMNSEIINHIKHMVNHAGIEAVGFGSDFDGIDDAGEIGNYRGFEGLINSLSKEFKPRELDKICYKNTLRVIEEVL